MNPGTASHRLVKDILFAFIKKDEINCFQCGEKLTRDTFSIEHKVPWLDSDDPVGNYFDLNNISFSHKSCNYAAGRKPNKIHKDAKERSRVNFKKYYDKNTEDVLRRKRERYHATRHH